MRPVKLFFICCMLCFCQTPDLHAQSSHSIRIDVNISDSPLMELIKIIEARTDYRVMFNTSIDLEQHISIAVKQATIPEILDIALKGKPINYEIVGKQIVLKKAADTSQRNRLSGKITDSKGTPLVGVTVLIKGTSIGTTTNIEGKYSFVMDKPGGTLVISYLGYESQEISINNRTVIDIVLQDETHAIEDVVVIGYGTKNKTKIVGAVNQVSSETFENKAISNLGQALQGAIPNLNITFSDGQINRNASYNIRGTTSINGGNPLVLIDGVPGNLNLITPEDIQTVSVLKDASSAAIYGAQASYGVILVTTKKGESEKPRFRYSGSFGFSQPLKTPRILMDSKKYVDILQQAYVGWAGSELAALTQVASYLDAYEQDPSQPIGYVDNMYFSYITGKPTNWYNMIYNDTQPFNKHFVEVSGRSDKVNYYVSAGMTNQDGAYRINTDHLRKYSMRAKLDVKLTKNISIFNNFSIEDSKYVTPITTVSGSNNILRFMTQLCAPFSSPYDNEGNYSYGGMVSEGLLKEGGSSIQRNNMVRNTFGVEINLLKGDLKIKGDYSIWWDRARGDDQKFRLSYSPSPGKVSELSAMSDYYKSAYSQSIRQTVNVYANYNKKFGDHTIEVIAGLNQDQNDYTLFSGQIDDNMFTTYGSLNLGDGIQSVADSANEWITLGLFYRASYDYKSKYLVELNGRYDGTSRFPSRRRWGFFPSAAIGWVVSEEPFMDFAKPALDILKIRASYGSLGNQQVDAYSYFATMSKKQMSYLVDGEKIYYMTTPGLVANDLTWETVVSKNLGIDLGMFRNRLNIGFDIYERETLDMLAAGVSLPATLGATAPEVNSADLSVKGWEASIMWRDKFRLFGKDAHYSVRFVMADNKAVITRFSGNDGQLLSGYNVGEEIGTIWGLETLGFFSSDEEAAGWADQTEVTTNMKNIGAGDIKFADLDKNGKITKGKETLYDHGDLKRIGNTSIRFPYSIDLSLNWNNFDLNVFFQGVGKREFYPGPEAALFWGFYNRYYNPVMEHHVDNFWTPENPNAYFPRLRAYMANNTTNELGVSQTKYLQDASYLRLKTLTFGYTIPRHLTQKLRIEKLRVFFSGQNLLTFTKLHEAFDPEAISNISSNGAGLVYPIQRTFTFGIDLNF